MRMSLFNLLVQKLLGCLCRELIKFSDLLSLLKGQVVHQMSLRPEFLPEMMLMMMMTMLKLRQS